MDIKLPKHTALVLRATGEFSVFVHVDGISVLIGPDRSGDRVFRMRSAQFDRDLVVACDGQVYQEFVPEAASREYPDPRPVEVPLAFQRPMTLQEQMKQLIRDEVSRAAAGSDLGTFEEEDDFGWDEDEDALPSSPYEVKDMPVDPIPVPAEPTPAAVPPVPNGSSPVGKDNGPTASLQPSGADKPPTPVSGTSPA